MDVLVNRPDDPEVREEPRTRRSSLAQLRRSSAAVLRRSSAAIRRTSAAVVRRGSAVLRRGSAVGGGLAEADGGAAALGPARAGDKLVFLLATKSDLVPEVTDAHRASLRSFAETHGFRGAFVVSAADQADESLFMAFREMCDAIAEPDAGKIATGLAHKALTVAASLVQASGDEELGVTEDGVAATAPISAEAPEDEPTPATGPLDLSWDPLVEARTPVRAPPRPPP